MANKLVSFLSKHRNFLLWIGIALLLVVLDQASKWIANCNLTVGQPVALIPNFLYASLSYNTKVAFSWGIDGIGGRILNISISLVMSVVIGIYWAFHHKKFKKVEKIIALLLFAGAVGNLIDRAFYWQGIVGFDGVIDFIQFYLGGGPNASPNFFNPFATFNFADSYLTIGIIMLLVFIIVDMVKNGDKSLQEDPRAAKPQNIEENIEEDNSSSENVEEQPTEKEEAKENEEDNH